MLELIYPSATPLLSPVPGESRSCHIIGNWSVGAGHFLVLVPTPLTLGPLHCHGLSTKLYWATRGLCICGEASLVPPQYLHDLLTSLLFLFCWKAGMSVMPTTLSQCPQLYWYLAALSRCLMSN